MPSVRDTILSNHRNQELIRSDSFLSNHDSGLAGCDINLSMTIEFSKLKVKMHVSKIHYRTGINNP
jgi:hypothetical protein